MRFLILLVLASLSGCAVSSYCTGEQDYQKARSVPPVKTVDGIEVPQSPSALRIPDPPANAIAYGEAYKDAEGDDRVRCLDTPPELPPTPAPAATEQPAT